MKKTAILFDHDGTLVNSINAVGVSTNIVLKRHGYRELSTEEILEGFPYATAERFLYHVKSEDRKTGKTLADDFYVEMHKSGIEHLEIYPGIQTALDSLAAYGYSMGLVTNNQGIFVRKAAAYLHYAYNLEIILGEENAVKPKPAPDGILQACAGLGAEPANCWYIGDTDIDFTAARAAGAKSGLVCWGVQTYEQLSELKADAIFRTPEEMTEFFLSL